MIDIEQIRRSVSAAVDRAIVDRDPFAHFRMEEIFPKSVYHLLIDNVPDPKLYHEIMHKDAIRPDGTSTRTMFEFFDDEFAKLDVFRAKIWSAIRDVLYTRELQEMIFEKFAPEIGQRVNSDCKHMQLRCDEASRVVAFPRPALYRDTAGYKITPHPDTPLKVVTMQFYLPRDDSQRSLGTSLYKTKTKLGRALTPWSGKYVTVKKLPFLPNTGYAFAVTQDSWHGRESVSHVDDDRYSIITFYLRDDVRLKY